MRERPLLFGDGDSLLGVLSEPAGGIDPSLPIVMMLNAGLIHHVGPNRLHVRLARRLAAQGVAALRVDLSGRGDSAPRRDGLAYVESGVVEVRAAMDRLQQLYGNSQQFVLLGICSGADTAGQVGCIDPRVTGLVVIEGAAYPTPRSRRRYVMTRIWRARTWANTLRGTNRVGAWLRRRLAQQHASEGAALIAHHGLASANAGIAAALQGLVDRGVEIFTVYTGSSAIYNYVGQVRDAFPQVRFGDRLQEGYYPRADHTFTRRSEQARFVSDLAAWMNDRWLAAGRRAAAPAADVWEPRAEMTEVVHL